MTDWYVFAVILGGIAAIAVGAGWLIERHDKADLRNMRADERIRNAFTATRDIAGPDRYNTVVQFPAALGTIAQYDPTLPIVRDLTRAEARAMRFAADAVHSYGSVYNPKTGESVHVDLNTPEGKAAFDAAVDRLPPRPVPVVRVPRGTIQNPRDPSPQRRSTT